MSSSARAVFFGSPPGIFLLTKWITCSVIFGRPPVVAGGRVVCALAAGLNSLLPNRCALKPHSSITRARQLDRLRIRGVQEEHRGRSAGVELLLAHATQQVAHRHADIAEVDIDRARRLALVADGAVVSDVAKIRPSA